MKLYLITFSIVFISLIANAQWNYDNQGRIYDYNGNVGIGIGISNPQNKLQIGPNPQGWNGNDLVISNTIGGNTNWTQVLISNVLDHSMIYGSADIAIRPGFGKWSIYAKGSNAYVGIGHNAPLAMLHVAQTNNSDWAGFIQNSGGTGKGLLVRSASGDATPTFQIEDNLGNIRFRVNSNGASQLGGDLTFNLAGRKIQFYEDANHRAQITLYDGSNGNINIENYWSEGNSDIFIKPDRNLHLRHGDNSTAGIFVLQSGSGSYEVTNNKILFTGTETGTTENPYGLRKDIQWLIGQEAGQHFTFKHGLTETEFLRISNTGYVGIGTTNPTQKLTVNGTVYSTEVKVDVNAGTGPDYVFEPTYQLPALTEIENYINANKHLPEVPSAKEMETNGINLSEMNMLLLKKVEELTLYVIELKKENEKQNEVIQTLLKK